MKSLITWVDIEDGHEYHEGEPFPHDGREIPEERIKGLATAENQIGRPVIIVDKVEKPGKKNK